MATQPSLATSAYFERLKTVSSSSEKLDMVTLSSERLETMSFS